MFKNTKSLMLVLVSSLVAMSSAAANSLPAGASATVNSFSDAAYCADLLAGQTILAGSVCYDVDLDSDQLTVTYVADNGWALLDTHLWVGDDAAAYPQTKNGNPKNGQFPYASGGLNGVSSYSVVIDLNSTGLANFYGSLACDQVSTFYAMAHAVVGKANSSGGMQTETAWSDGERVMAKGNWATETTLDVLVSCDPIEPPKPPVSYGNETAFAVFTTGTDPVVDANQSACFLDLGLGIKRWGWTNALPADSGSSILAIYAGAGRCDISKGTLVGYLEVTPTADAGVLEVTYNAFESYLFSQFHLYVGNEMLALDVNGEPTVAPGQFPIVMEVDGTTTGQTFLVNVPAGALYLVAHAVALIPAQ